MILYTCGTKTAGPGFAHPCSKAGNALDAAGYEYELKTVGGYRLMPWTWGRRKEDRAEVRELSGTDEVPILVLDDGEVVSGSGAIAKWAKEHPASRGAGSVGGDQRHDGGYQGSDQAAADLHDGALQRVELGIELRIHPGEAGFHVTFDPVEARTDTLVGRIETPVDFVEAPVDISEALIDPFETLVDPRELDIRASEPVIDLLGQRPDFLVGPTHRLHG